MNNQARNVSHPMFGNFRDFTVHSTVWGISSSTQLLPVPKATRSKSDFVTILSPAGNSSLLFIDDVDIAEKHSLNKKMDKWETKIGVLFRCLETGQMSKGCAWSFTCQLCSDQHPTSLPNASGNQGTWKGDESKTGHKWNTIASALVEIDGKRVKWENGY